MRNRRRSTNSRQADSAADEGYSTIQHGTIWDVTREAGLPHRRNDARKMRNRVGEISTPNQDAPMANTHKTMRSPQRPLWRCPRCGHTFVTKNLWHSCGRYRIADHFRGKPRILRQTFERLVKVARSGGKITVYAQKTRIVIQNRVRFAGVVVRSESLDVGLWLKRRVEHPLIRRVESLGRLGFGIHYYLGAPEDIDEAMVESVQEAYSIAGNGRSTSRRIRA